MSDITPSEERKELTRYRVENRVKLLERVSRGASTAIDTLIAASANGDIRASEAILRKVLPDLKAVDVTNTGEGVQIIINQKIYPGRQKKGQSRVETPAVNINITERKPEKSVEYQTIDITPNVSVSEPPEQKRDHSVDRRKGVFR